MAQNLWYIGPMKKFAIISVCAASVSAAGAFGITAAHSFAFQPDLQAVSTHALSVVPASLVAVQGQAATIMASSSNAPSLSPAHLQLAAVTGVELDAPVEQTGALVAQKSQPTTIRTATQPAIVSGPGRDARTIWLLGVFR